MGGAAQVPLWITIALGVLAVVGTIGGNWLGQFVAGRNQIAHWERERAREAHTFWRDKRLAAYAKVLATFEQYVDQLYGEAGLAPTWADEDRVTLDSIKRDLDMVRMIGSPAAVSATDELLHQCALSASQIRHPSRQGRDADWPMRDAEPALDELSSKVRALRVQYRADLAVVPATTEVAP